MAIYRYNSLPSMEAMGINPNSNSKITAIKDQTGKVTGYEVNTNNNKEVEEFDVFNISSNLKTSMNDINYSKKTNNVFKFQLDGIRITNLQDKNGINITKYVKGCNVLKIDDSKIYLDNGNIIYYDQDGFKYIYEDNYIEYTDYNCENHTGIYKFGCKPIVYYDRPTQNLVENNNLSDELSSTVETEIINDIKNDENIMKFYKLAFPDDEDLNQFYSAYRTSVNSTLSYDIYIFFKLYENKENEFEKTFGFPMYVINKDGLKVYNNYKFKFLIYLFHEMDYERDLFRTLLINDYNIEIKKNDISDKYTYLELINNLNNLKKQYNNIFINFKISKNVKKYDSFKDEYYSNSTIFYMNDAYLEEVLKDGSIVLIDRFHGKYIISFNDLLFSSPEISIKTIGIDNVSIFDEDNIKSLQYGGDQATFSRNAKELLEDPIIVEKLRQCYPDATMEDYELYLNKLSSTGCGYIALINTVFFEFIGREKEFEEKFGFPMYVVKSGKLDFNYEYLVLDYFNYIWGNTGYTIQELCGNVILEEEYSIPSKEMSKEIDFGAGDEIKKQFSFFLKEMYDCDVKVTINTPDTFYESFGKINRENAFDIYNKIKTNTNQVCVSCGGYDLYNMDGSIAIENGGGHSMYITGVTDDNRFIVSSWGEKYILGLDAFIEGYDRSDKYLCFKIVEYD